MYHIYCHNQTVWSAYLVVHEILLFMWSQRNIGPLFFSRQNTPHYFFFILRVVPSIKVLSLQRNAIRAHITSFFKRIKLNYAMNHGTEPKMIFHIGSERASLVVPKYKYERAHHKFGYCWETNTLGCSSRFALITAEKKIVQCYQRRETNKTKKSKQPTFFMDSDERWFYGREGRRVALFYLVFYKKSTGTTAKSCFFQTVLAHPSSRHVIL